MIKKRKIIRRKLNEIERDPFLSKHFFNVRMSLKHGGNNRMRQILRVTNKLVSKGIITEKSNPLYNIIEEFSKRREEQCKKLRKKRYTSKMFYEKYRSKCIKENKLW